MRGRIWGIRSPARSRLMRGRRGNRSDSRVALLERGLKEIPLHCLGATVMARIETQMWDRRTALGVIGCAALGALMPGRAAAKVVPIDPGSWTIAVLPEN